jgi:hypothetical protein
MTTDLPAEPRSSRFACHAIAEARECAVDLVDRLVRTAGPGEHLVLCVTKQAGGVPTLHAALAISGSRAGGDCEDRAEVPDDESRRTVGALLMFGRLAREPVGLIMRSCEDGRHDVPGHACVVRGWVVRDGRAHPMSQGAIRNVAGGGLGPHPCLPPHPLTGTRYESAYPLSPAE